MQAQFGLYCRHELVVLSSPVEPPEHAPVGGRANVPHGLLKSMIERISEGLILE